MRILAYNEDGFGDGQDITEAVQALYDLALDSMNYGSGFWGYEDAAPVLKLAKLMSWEGMEGLQKYHDDELFKCEQSAYLRAEDLSPFQLHGSYVPVVKTRSDGSVITRHVFQPNPHEHEFSATGPCLFPKCPETSNRDGSSQA